MTLREGDSVYILSKMFLGPFIVETVTGPTTVNLVKKDDAGEVTTRMLHVPMSRCSEAGI